MKRLRAVLTALAFISQPAGMARAGDPTKIVWPGRLNLAQGEIVEVRVQGPELAAVEGQMGKEAIQFYFSEAGIFSALVGADLEARPGPMKFTIEATTRAGSRKKKEVIVEIKSKSYPKESFTVPLEFDQLSDELLERIRREREQFSRAFRTSSRQRLWQSPFIEPVAGEISSPFGLRRIINGTPRAPHSGADLRAPMGTPVLAVNDGRVVLTGDFFYSGKSLILDHGGGLFTMYFHLSELQAEEQALVRRGEVIAFSGMTGRVNGPHLHWGARINNARVDPFELIARTSLMATTGQESKTAAGKTEK